MKKFDWDHAKTIHRPEWYEWLLNNWKRPITRGEYVAAYNSFRATDPRPHLAHKYYLKHIEHQYENLKEKFGFFV